VLTSCARQDRDRSGKGLLCRTGALLHTMGDRETCEADLEAAQLGRRSLPLRPPWTRSVSEAVPRAVPGRCGANRGASAERDLSPAALRAVQVATQRRTCSAQRNRCRAVSAVTVTWRADAGMRIDDTASGRRRPWHRWGRDRGGVRAETPRGLATWRPLNLCGAQGASV